MFKKILIANRGEIALRIIRTCKEMGIETVAVYSTADKDSLHVRFADEAVCIGPAPSRESYLNIPRIIAAAEITNADAIHPGYGFLSENAEFSKICEEYGIKFIGASAEMINQMGDKATAKATMKAAGVPTIPGSEGILDTMEQGIKLSNEMGYPVILKATAGGGGRGMRIVKEEAGFKKAWDDARMESGAAFGNDGLYLEKYVEEPRHIEIQIIGDKTGKACRIQVEHPITEEVTDFDLIKEQIKVAAGDTISGRNYYPKLYAMECRINAEDPANGFRPSPGKIQNLHIPGGRGVRIDSHVYAGYIIPPNYDSMIAKLIVSGQSREEVIVRMKRALEEFVIDGIKTTIPFHIALLENEQFKEGNFTTKFLEDFDFSVIKG